MEHTLILSNKKVNVKESIQKRILLAFFKTLRKQHLIEDICSLRVITNNQVNPYITLVPFFDLTFNP